MLGNEREAGGLRRLDDRSRAVGEQCESANAWSAERILDVGGMERAPMRRDEHLHCAFATVSDRAAIRLAAGRRDPFGERVRDR
jgi:hypothetical protein